MNINDLVEYNDQKFNRVTALNEPDLRVLLLCMRAGQQVPEHSAAGSITVQAITGHATFHHGEEPCEMFAGTLVRLEAGRPHRVEAHADTVLLVTMTKPSKAINTTDEPRTSEQEIDLSTMPRVERHPLVFAAFDRLAVGESFIIANDHDPMPLRMQLESLREGEMNWEYLLRGAEAFRIRIRRIAWPTGRTGSVSSGTAASPVTIG